MYFDANLYIFVGNKGIHNVLDEFKFRHDVSRPRASKNRFLQNFLVVIGPILFIQADNEFMH